MARKVSIDAIDAKIVKAKEIVEKAKERYDIALANLKELNDKKEEIKHKEIVDEILNSGIPYEDLLDLIKKNPKKTVDDDFEEKEPEKKEITSDIKK